MSKFKIKNLLLVLLILSLLLGCAKKNDDNPVGPSNPVPTTGTITGKAVLSGASDHTGIAITGAGDTSTNGSGEYTISNVNAGTYNLTASKSGYNNATKSITVIAGQTAAVEQMTLTSTSGGETNPPPPHPTGPTTINSNITTNTTWTASLSPYMVTQDISVNPGVTLTIEPGATVKTDKIITVNGTLTAAGTSASHITFTKNSVGGGRIDLVGDTNNHQLSYCELTYIFIRALTSTTTNVAYCKFTNCGSVGGNIAVYSNGTFYLGYCTFDSNYSVGVTGTGGTIIVSYSIITNTINTNAFSAYGSINVGNCNLTSNAGYTVRTNTATNATFNNNWWGTTNTATIDSMIYDYYDIDTIGRVYYTGYKSNSISGAGCGW